MKQTTSTRRTRIIGQAELAAARIIGEDEALVSADVTLGVIEGELGELRLVTSEPATDE